jgi:hypothetical protein
MVRRFLYYTAKWRPESATNLMLPVGACTAAFIMTGNGIPHIGKMLIFVCLIGWDL